MGKGSSETQTNRLGKSDAAEIEKMRRYGQSAADSAGRIQHVGANPMTREAEQLYRNMGGGYQNMYESGMGTMQAGMASALQTGLGGLDQYTNPLIGYQMAGMDPVYDRMRAMASNSAADQATQAGAFGGGRSAILEAQMVGDVNQQQGAHYGNMWSQAGAQGLQAMMQERARMQGLMGMGGNMAMGGLGGLGGVAGNLAGLGDYNRQIAMDEQTREFRNKQLQQQALQQGYGKDIQTSQTTEKKGNLFGDLMGLGSMVGGLMTGGAAMPILSQFGGGAMGSESIASSPIMQQGAGLMNYGGYNPASAMGPGGGGGGLGPMGGSGNSSLLNYGGGYGGLGGLGGGSY